jgi:membrane-associated phospholipid phosphatase
MTSRHGRALVAHASGPRRSPLRPRVLVRAAWERRREPGARAQLLLLVACAAALLGFAHVTEDYLTGDPLVRWDVHFAAWLHAHANGSLLRLFDVVTFFGSVPFLGLLTVAGAVVLVRRRAAEEAALLCVVALGIEILNALLKLAFHRPRPELTYVHLDTYSFPSGHAAGSTAIWGVLLFLLARRLARPARIACGVAWVALVVAIGFSRLYLEAHYLSDVLAGISLGAAWLAAWLLVFVTRGERSVLRRLGRLADRVGASSRRGG